MRTLQRGVMLCIAFLYVTSSSPASGQSCIGDCDGNDVVTIGELITGVNIALDIRPIDDCRAFDTNANGGVDIGELIAAVGNALEGCDATPTPTPQLEGTDVVEGAARVAVENVEAIELINFGFVAANPVGSGSQVYQPGQFRLAASARVAVAPTAALMQAGTGQGLPLPELCPDGGSADVQCDNETSTLTVDYRDCRTLTASNHTVIRNGFVAQTVSNPTFCDTGEIGVNDTVTLVLQGFEQTERDVDDTLLARIVATVTDTFIRDGEGCPGAGPEGTEIIDGSLTVECVVGAETLDCSRGASDLALVADDLALERTSGGFPCELGITADGDLSVDDRIDRERFTETFAGFVFTEIALDSGGSTITEDGLVTVDCLGGIEFETNRDVPLVFPEETACPVGGELAVRRPSRGGAADAGAVDAGRSLPDRDAGQGSGGLPDGTFRERLFGTANGQVYQVLQNASVDAVLGAEAIQITSVVGSLDVAVGSCVAFPSPRLQAVTAVTGGTAFPPTSVFKSPIIPDATVPCFNGTGNGGAGRVCIGPECTGDCACLGGADCATFTITEGTVITEATEDIPAASLVAALELPLAPCSGFAGTSTYRFGPSGPTVETLLCAPAPDDGFRLPSEPSAFVGGTEGTTVIFSYATPGGSLFAAGSAGFPIDVDGDNQGGCEGPDRVLTLGRANLDVIPAFIAFTETGGVEFDFNDDQVIDETQPTCAIDALAQCQVAVQGSR